MPAGAGECLIALSGWSKQLTALFSANFTAPQGASVPNDSLINGRVYQLDVSVRLIAKDAEITVLRDQQPLMHWRGPQSDLVVPTEWALGHPDIFGIGGDNALVVASARVRPIGGGKAEATR